MCYNLGANSYIIKPMSFDDLIKNVKCLADYWFGIAELPPPERPKACAPLENLDQPECA